MYARALQLCLEIKPTLCTYKQAQFPFFAVRSAPPSLL